MISFISSLYQRELANITLQPSSPELIATVTPLNARRPSLVSSRPTVPVLHIGISSEPSPKWHAQPPKAKVRHRVRSLDRPASTQARTSMTAERRLFRGRRWPAGGWPPGGQSWWTRAHVETGSTILMVDRGPKSDVFHAWQSRTSGWRKHGRNYGVQSKLGTRELAW
jgi:hypothetical protein